MECRFNPDKEGCSEIFKTPSSSSSSDDELLSVESMAVSECQVYNEIITDALDLNAPLTSDNFLEGGRSFSTMKMRQCNGMTGIMTYCGKFSGGKTYNCKNGR